MNLRTVLFAVIALASAPSFAGMQPLAVPAPIEIPSIAQSANVALVIKSALAADEWVIPFERRGYIEAEKKHHALRLHIGLLYDTRRIRMVYLESHGYHYNFEDGAVIVHPNLNKRMREVDARIRQALGLPVPKGD